MKNYFIKIVISITTLIIILTSSTFGQEASFAPFSFSTNFSTSEVFDPARDVRLDSIIINGQKLSNFVLVQRTAIIENNQGLLSAVHGLNTPSDPLVTEGPATANPTDKELTASLNNLNLNSLVNTKEAPGTAIVDIFFAQAQNTFLFWERGGEPQTNIAGNSALRVEALTDDGLTVLASYRININDWTNAGFSLQSTIPNAPIQNVGSLGLKLVGIKSRRLRLSSSNPEDAGPDYKVLAVINL